MLGGVLGWYGATTSSIPTGTCEVQGGVLTARKISCILVTVQITFKWLPILLVSHALRQFIDAIFSPRAETERSHFSSYLLCLRETRDHVPLGRLVAAHLTPVETLLCAY